MKSAGNTVPTRTTAPMILIQRCFMIFPQESGMQTLRNARLKRWILMTTNRRLSTEVRRFLPKHYSLLASERYPLHIDGQDVENKLDHRPARKRAPQAKANHRCCGAPCRRA